MSTSMNREVHLPGDQYSNAGVFSRFWNNNAKPTHTENVTELSVWKEMLNEIRIKMITVLVRLVVWYKKTRLV